MPSFLNNSLSLVVLISTLVLSGCSNLVPRQHSDYTGSDAATLLIHQQGGDGYFTLLNYENKGECYDRTETHTFQSGSLDTSRRIFTLKIQPGKLLAVQQIYADKKTILSFGTICHGPGDKEVSFYPSAREALLFCC